MPASCLLATRVFRFTAGMTYFVYFCRAVLSTVIFWGRSQAGLNIYGPSRHILGGTHHPRYITGRDSLLAGFNGIFFGGIRNHETSHGSNFVFQVDVYCAIASPGVRCMRQVMINLPMTKTKTRIDGGGDTASYVPSCIEQYKTE